LRWVRERRQQDRHRAGWGRARTSGSPLLPTPQSSSPDTTLGTLLLPPLLQPGLRPPGPHGERGCGAHVLAAAPSPFFWASVSPGTDWGRPAQPRKSRPALGLPGGGSPGALRTCSSLTSVARLPISQTFSGHPRGSAQPQSSCWVPLWAWASLCPTSPQRGRQAPAGQRQFRSWLGLSLPHGPVLPRGHKLQRLKSGGRHQFRERSSASSRRARQMGERGAPRR